MLKRLGLLLIVGAMFLPLGCSTNRPYIWSWPHHKRRILTIFEDFHNLHKDIDRIFFDMDYRPLEDVD